MLNNARVGLLTVAGNTWATTYLKFCTYMVVSPFSGVPGDKKELDFGLLWTLECLCRLYQVNTPKWVGPKSKVLQGSVFFFYYLKHFKFKYILIISHPQVFLDSFPSLPTQI